MGLIERPSVVNRSFSRAVGTLLVLLCLGYTSPVGGQELNGVWLSPDWLFPGHRRYGEEEVRKTARAVLADLSAQGVDTVFLETFLRGYGICPAISREKGAPRVVSYRPGGPGHPVYPHLLWDYRVEFDTVLDPLQIFIEEGMAEGIEVHAWVHLFYWRMDNTDIMLDWHNGPSLWAELMADYLSAQAARLALVQDRSVRPGYEQSSEASIGDDLPFEILEEAAELFRSGCDTAALETLLAARGLNPAGHPLGRLVAAIIGSGGEPPDFLLLGPPHDPFPAPRGGHLRSVYVDPAHPSVRARLVEAIENIAAGHPGLAGVHLDHVRYPVDGQGLGRDTGVRDGRYRYFSATDPDQMREYRNLSRALEERREALHSLVEEIAGRLPRRMKLSAAVLPLYYRDRDLGGFRTSGYDYSAQAWLDWPVDFVVPMMYEYHPYLIRSLVQQYQALANSARPEKPIAVYPGISRLRYTRDGSVEPRGWVFFDLSLARDVKNPRREAEDLDFGGE